MTAEQDREIQFFSLRFGHSLTLGVHQPDITDNPSRQGSATDGLLKRMRMLWAPLLPQSPPRANQSHEVAPFLDSLLQIA
jgi:hypothetical protein